MSSDDEVKKLQEKVAALEAELKELKGRDLSPGKQRKMSAAKLETLEETGDEATQAYIKSQFVSRELSSGSVVASKDFRRAGNAIMAANKFKASGASAPAPAPVDPRNSHAVAAVHSKRDVEPNGSDLWPHWAAHRTAHGISHDAAEQPALWPSQRQAE